MRRLNSCKEVVMCLVFLIQMAVFGSSFAETEVLPGGTLREDGKTTECFSAVQGTICVWFRKANVWYDEKSKRIFVNGGLGASHDALKIYVQKKGDREILFVDIKRGEEPGTALAKGVVLKTQPYEWCHLVFSWDSQKPLKATNGKGDHASIYLNGVEIPLPLPGTTLPWNPGMKKTKLELGCDEIEVDSLAIYDSPLSSTEVQDIYSKGREGVNKLLGSKGLTYLAVQKEGKLKVNFCSKF